MPYQQKIHDKKVGKLNNERICNDDRCTEYSKRASCYQQTPTVLSRRKKTVEILAHLWISW